MIKAIETSYKGYRFRSRLEARWAVFFDAMGLDWSYEPQGFDLGKLGWYLPDFVISSYGSNPSCIPTEETMKGARSHFFIEIKGKEPAKNDCEKLSEVCEAHTCYGALFFGDIPKSWRYMQVISVCKEGGYGGDNSEDFWYWFGGCRLKDGTLLNESYCGSIFEDYELQEQVNFALMAARSARFEHGENPNKVRKVAEKKPLWFVRERTKYDEDLDLLKERFLKGKKCYYAYIQGEDCTAEPRNIGDFSDWPYQKQEEVVQKQDLNWLEENCIPVCHQHYHEKGHDGGYYLMYTGD